MLFRDPLPDPGAGARWRALSSRTASSRGKRESGLDGDGRMTLPLPRHDQRDRSGGSGAPRQARLCPGAQPPRSREPSGRGQGGPRSGPSGWGGVSSRPPAGRRRPRPPGTAAFPGLVPLSWAWPAQGCLSERRNFTLFTRFHKQEHQHSLVANFCNYCVNHYSTPICWPCLPLLNQSAGGSCPPAEPAVRSEEVAKGPAVVTAHCRDRHSPVTAQPSPYSLSNLGLLP